MMAQKLPTLIPRAPFPPILNHKATPCCEGTLKNLVELGELMTGCKSSSSVAKKKKWTVAGEGRSAAFPRVAKLGLCRNA